MENIKVESWGEEIQWGTFENDKDTELKIKQFLEARKSYQPKEPDEDSLNKFATGFLRGTGFGVDVETKWITFENNKKVFNLKTRSPKTGNRVETNIELYTNPVLIENQE